MPPIRAIPTVRPIRTERTHEENQERAYIAASRRSDRSLEARVESARRASEIHKKRTGRSLRVREEDVMNEEMYEEEDDDLPMQYRRINALNPGLAYSAFNERVNSYLAGQIGVRNYLHQAIYQANQNQYANQFLNPMMHHHNFPSGTMSPQAMNGLWNAPPQSSWPINDTPGVRSSPHGRSASIATTQELANYTQTQTAPMHPATSFGLGERRMSAHNARSPGIPSPATTASQPPTPHPHGKQQSSPRPRQVPTPPQSGQTQHTEATSAGTPPHSGQAMHDRSVDAQVYPLTTKLPVETQQLIDGQPAFANAVHPSQLTPGIPMPSMSVHSFNPGEKKSKSKETIPSGLHQTLSPYNMHSHQANSPPSSEPQSAMSAPANLDFGFNSDMYEDLEMFNNPGYSFDLDFGSSNNTGAAHNSGQVTPDAEGNWTDTDFFNYAAASD